LRIFGNKELHRIFGPRREEVIGGCRKLHIGELHKLLYLPHLIKVMKSRMMRRGRVCSTHG
jgi:hypothetical protein